MAGWLKRELPSLQLERLEDCRRRQGQRWALVALLKAALVGLLSGCQSLARVEWLTEDMSQAMRKLLAIPRRVADTTLRDTLVKLDLTGIRLCLRAFIHLAHRRKALAPVGLPFGVVAMDGKSTALPWWDFRYAIRVVHEKTLVAYGLLRTITCVLVSAAGKPCLDAMPLLAGANEVSSFQGCFESLVTHFGSLFQLVTYDAGGTSEENARAVVEAGKDYLFRIKHELFFMTKAAMGWLGAFKPDEARASSTDVLSKRDEDYVVRRVFLCKVKQWGIFTVWSHAKTFVRVQSQRLRKGLLIAEENRYYASSLALDVLTAEQWLAVVRNHWGVESCHNVFDSIFKEDDKPWIETSPQGALAALLLRRIAYTLLTLFKHRTLKSDDSPTQSWRRLMQCLYNAITGATSEQLSGLRDSLSIAVS
jgi:hypothetical protein